MSRTAGVIVFALLAMLSIANLALFVGHRRRPPTSSPGQTSMERWLALPPARRAAYVQHYMDLARRDDLAAVLRRAREFAGLPPARQARLREAYAVFWELLEAQSPGRRGEWLRAPERTRGFLAFQALRSEQPERLASLRSAWAAPP